MLIHEFLAQHGVLAHVVIPTEIDLLLHALDTTAAPADQGGGIFTGKVVPNGDLSKSPIPGFDFHLTLPANLVDAADFKIKLDPAINPTSFKFWINLATQGQVAPAFKLIEGIPGLLFTGAKPVTDPARGTTTLQPIPGSEPKLVCVSGEQGAALGPALLITGSPAAPAAIRFTPDTDSTEGIVALGFDQPAVVFGSSGIGFVCPAFIIDDSLTAHGPGQGVSVVDPPLPHIPADDDPWTGILAREVDFYLPASVPFFGGHPIKGYVAIPRGRGGAELVIETTVPPRAAANGVPAAPGYSIRIEARDPTATGFAGLVPTLIRARMELPVDGAKLAPASAAAPLTFAAGKPLTLTATFARDPVNAPGVLSLGIDVTAAGADGLVFVASHTGDPAPSAAKIFNTAAAMVTALIASGDMTPSSGSSIDQVLTLLAAAGAAASSFFKPESQFVLHGAAIETAGNGLPVGGPITVWLDYSVAVRVTKLGIPEVAALSVEMRDDQPMRIRIHRVALTYDQGAFSFDFDRAEMEIEDPGAWDIGGLKQLFDVIGSRSGRGSTWLEVDLRFKLDLGPIKVSGVTIRATLAGGPVPAVTLRGLDASIDIPGAISGSGGVQLVPGGFEANLAAGIVPLQFNADAWLDYAPPKIVLGLEADLPAPIPLANSGLGVFGIGGMVGFGAVPQYNTGIADPILRQLAWEPKDAGSFATATGQSTFGLAAVVGTFPDFGFSFSAKAGVVITVPDVAVRGALNGKVLGPVTRMSDPSVPTDPGISYLGFISVDSSAVLFAVMGEVKLDPLLHVHVPVAGSFPLASGETDDWYVYLGADGYPDPSQGRSIGPISATVLPDILGLEANAYLMFRGRGIADWPYGHPVLGAPITLKDGFVVAFGFGLQSSFGARPIAWADLYASLDLLVGANPVTLAGFGRAGGGLHLGPFSLGVEAQASFIAQGGQHYLWLQVTGRIELLFVDIEGTVTISFGTKQQPTLPPPDRHPLDRFGPDQTRLGSTAALTDDAYRVLCYLVEDPAALSSEDRVWPDAMISIPFSAAPAAQDSGVFPSSAITVPYAPAPAPIGTEMLNYTWHLNGLSLVDVTDEADPKNGPGKPPPGQLPVRWQAPRGAAGPVAELVIGTTSGDLWVNRRPDAGAGLSPDPLAQNASWCTVRAAPRPGWAIGAGARAIQGGLRLPPDPLSLDPLQSRVAADLHHSGLRDWAAPEALDDAYTYASGFWRAPAEIVPWPQPDTIEREFTGHLTAPCLRYLGRSEPGPVGQARYLAQQIDLDLTSSALTQGVLVLVADRKLLDIQEFETGIIVRDDDDQWERESGLITIPTGETAAIYRQRTPNPIGRVTVIYPLNATVGVAGLGGLTVAAVDAAQQATQAAQALNNQNAAAKAAGPKTDPATITASQRAILAPGGLYRLDIDMSWDGELWTQDAQGARVPVTSVTNQQTYGPGGAPTRRQLFFATAAKPPAATLPKVAGMAGYAAWLHRTQDVFQPELIARYLGGYTPAQSEPFYFCDDPLQAHFTQDHVPALAKAYGFTPTVAVRRTDRPGAADASPTLLVPVWSFATDKRFLGPVDQRRFDLALTSPCNVPSPGTTGTALAPLEPESWYEVYVLAKADPGTNDADGRLPGVTFRTSRWRSPEDMFRGLGLDVPAAGLNADQIVSGDLVASTTTVPGGAIIDGDDQAFLRALAALGLEGWPVATAPRLSRFWTHATTGEWLFAGIMLESPEPIQRPGRLECDPAGPTMEMGQAGAGVTFDIHRSDRSGSRLLYLTSAPFRIVTSELIPLPRWPFLRALGGPQPLGGIGNIRPVLKTPSPAYQSLHRAISPTLVLTATSLPPGKAGQVVGKLVLPAQPGFAEEL